MKPFCTPAQIYKQSRERTEKLLKQDSSLNVRTRDRSLNEYRAKQSDYLLNADCLPLELLMQFEKDSINMENEMTLKQFTEKAENLSNLNPLFADDQIDASRKKHWLNEWQLARSKIQDTTLSQPKTDTKDNESNQNKAKQKVSNKKEKENVPD